MWISTSASNAPYSLVNTDNIVSVDIEENAWAEPGEKSRYSLIACNGEMVRLLAKKLTLTQASEILDSIAGALSLGINFYEIDPMMIAGDE